MRAGGQKTSSGGGPVENWDVDAAPRFSADSLVALTTPAELLTGVQLERQSPNGPQRIEGRTVRRWTSAESGESIAAPRGGVDAEWVSARDAAGVQLDSARRHRELLSLYESDGSAAGVLRYHRQRFQDWTPIALPGLGDANLVTSDPDAATSRAAAGNWFSRYDDMRFAFIFARGPVLAALFDTYASERINFERALFLAYALDKRIADAPAAGESPMR